MVVVCARHRALALIDSWLSRGAAAVARDHTLWSSTSQQDVRSFAIIAHVDHGKSTLSDRLLELSGAIPPGGRARFLDKLAVERERGITVKAQSVSLRWKGRILQLIDTPGHVDFAHEVARSLAAVQGCVLLVDATQGVQAQTVANWRSAVAAGLHILPAISKCDMPMADPQRVTGQMVTAFGVDAADVLRVSGKTGPLRALLLDAHYDSYRGCVCLVQVVDGSLRLGERIESVATGESVEVLELGFLVPEPMPLSRAEALSAGHTGYVITSSRSVASAKIGDTLRHVRSTAPPLPGIAPARAQIFQGIFPPSAEDYEALKAAIEKLTLNDSSVVLASDTSAALGPGYIAGFLGLLHAEVFHQRLRSEYGAEVIATAPTVPYRVTGADGGMTEIRSPSLLADTHGALVEEPMVVANLMTPHDCVGALVELCIGRRGVQLEHRFLDDNTALLVYRLPLAEIAADFADRIKSISTGFATMDYAEDGWQAADIVRVDILINGEAVDALASICHSEKATRSGRAIIAKLRELLPRQSFDIAIQAAARGRILARESISALRKNVLSKCYGGDVSRKKKLLQKQTEGKKRMKMIGRVSVPNEAFADLLRTSS